jgi:hypothetical protein
MQVNNSPSILFPGTILPTETQRRNDWDHLNLEHIFIDVQGYGIRKIEAFWIRGENCNPSDRTILVYHGNGSTLYNMSRQVNKYIKEGFNVLVSTMGGKQYPQSNPPQDANNDFYTNELSMYADIDGEMKFLQGKGVKSVGLHGQSMGGVKALEAAVKYHNRENFPRVRFVIAEQTLTSAVDVAGNFFRNIGKDEGEGKALGETLAEKNLRDDLNGHITDGMHNWHKGVALRETKVEVLTIASKYDDLMGRDLAEDGYRLNFAHDLLRARYGDDTDKKPFIIEGGHCSPIDDNTFDGILKFANANCPKSVME